MKPPEEVKRELVRQWLEKADEDLAAAHHLLNVTPPLLSVVGFHSQQAVEKCLKAFFVSRQINFPKTHDIEALLEIVNELDPFLSESLSETTVLTDYGVEVRYPGDLPAMTLEEAQTALALAEDTHTRIIAALNITRDGEG